MYAKAKDIERNTAKATDYNGYMIHHKLSEFESLLGGYYSVVNRKKSLESKIETLKNIYLNLQLKRLYKWTQ